MKKFSMLFALMPMLLFASDYPSPNRPSVSESTYVAPQGTLRLESGFAATKEYKSGSLAAKYTVIEYVEASLGTAYSSSFSYSPRLKLNGGYDYGKWAFAATSHFTEATYDGFNFDLISTSTYDSFSVDTMYTFERIAKRNDFLVATAIGVPLIRNYNTTGFAEVAASLEGRYSLMVGGHQPCFDRFVVDVSAGYGTLAIINRSFLVQLGISTKF